MRRWMRCNGWTRSADAAAARNLSGGLRARAWRAITSKSTRVCSSGRSWWNAQWPRIPMEIIEVGNEYYILAKSPLADDRTRVLKHGDTFAIFDRYGDIHPVGLREQGIYHAGTRFLSKLVLEIEDKRPMLLSSTIREDNVLLAVDLSNPDITESDAKLPRGLLHIYRSKFLWESVCYERLRLRNYSLDPVDSWLTLSFGADFADIFEVRGQGREIRGQRITDLVEDSSLTLSYEGLDRMMRRMRIRCDSRDAMLAPGEM